MALMHRLQDLGAHQLPLWVDFNLKILEVQVYLWAHLLPLQTSSLKRLIILRYS